jgi:hypothetical protein
MLLFPYAKDLEYKNKQLSFVISFMNKTSNTDIGITMLVDDNLSKIIEGLFDEPEDDEEPEFWTDL